MDNVELVAEIVWTNKWNIQGAGDDSYRFPNFHFKLKELEDRSLKQLALDHLKAFYTSPNFDEPILQGMAVVAVNIRTISGVTLKTT
jgi:hypothetical protein